MKKIWGQKTSLTKFYGEKKFQSRKFLVKKIRKNSVKKFFGEKKIFIEKNFAQKRFLSKKKLGRVNPGEGIYGPPPLENIRVKIVLNCC